MSPIQNMDQHSRRIVEPDIPIQARLQMATEVRDSLEITHSGEYLYFLKCYFTAFSDIMYHITSPQSVDNPEHKLRNIVLEILNRLPHSEAIRPFVQELMKIAMHVLTIDNEENGLICIRIIFDLLRNFRPTSESEIQPLFDFVCKIYHNFGSTVSYIFESSEVPPPASFSTNTVAGSTFGSMGGEDNKLMDVSDPEALSSSFPGAGKLNPSARSFKIVTETPLVVMFLFQLYSRFVQINIPLLLPLMVVAISVPGPEKAPPHLKGPFIEFKAAQVKTVSFLTYLLKSFADNIRPHEESICKSIVNLLVTCSDSVSIRKELLVALKHVLGTDFKRGLFPLIDTLLEERVLVGTGRACYETLRPLAYSLLAEIVHHVRVELSLRQLSRIIYLFSSNMHDASLSLSIHTTCARLMLNLVEPIFEKGVDKPSMDEARILLVRILDAFVGKFNTFKHTIPQLLEEEGEEGKERSTLRAKLELPVQAVLNLQVPLEHSKEVNDCKHLIKTLVMGMKTIVWSITHTHLPRSQSSLSTTGTPPQVPAPPSSSSIPHPFKGLREDEVWKASGVLKSGVHCLALFKDKDEEREMVHLFSQILAIMEPRDLMDIFSLCLPELFDSMITNSQLLHIFSTLLQTQKVFRSFADVLANFLVSSKFEVLKLPDSPEAKLVLHLYRFLFGAVAKAPSECERILQPHTSVIMETCMKNANEIGKPLGYLQLLRTMFRALAGGKFEILLRDLIPMLQPCLNMLLAMLEGPTAEDTRDLLLELCLTLPARLSSLLPHISRLMRPLVVCLKGSDDLVSLGLRTLEFWIDSLNPDFLEPSMANVMSEVILALWSHLRPAPYPWGAKSLQLLGKFGGRNIRFLKEPLALECKEIPEHGLRLILTFEPSTPFLVPLDRCVNLAVVAVMQKNGCVDPFFRKQALKFLHICLSSQLNLPGTVTDEGMTTKQLSKTLVSHVVESFCRTSDSSDIKADLGVKTKTQLMAEKSVFKILLMTIIAASGESDLFDPKDDFIVNICRHFAMIYHIESLSANTSSTSHGGSLHSSNASSSSRSRVSCSTNLKELDPLIFLDALVEVLADENRLHAKASLNALNVLSETLIFLARAKHTDSLMSKGGPVTPMIVSSPSMSPVYSPPPSVRVPVFEQLLPRLLHCCYGVTWQTQMGGVMGLGALVGKVTVETMCVFQVRIVRGLVYVLKRLPMFARKEQEETSQVLTQVLRVVNNVDEANSDARRQSFQGVVEYLASELLNPNSSVNVRKIVQSCLSLLASRTGSEVSELLETLQQPYLQNLVTRPLRSKTVDQQVGTVNALNFCLALRPPLLKLTPELVNFLQEALQIAEADESAWVVKIMNPKVATSLSKLRTACIELLCTAMAWTDFKTQNHSELRAKIISMFFKSLTSRMSDIVAVAKEGLRQVILQQRMPKELLQSSLRPILVNLAHTKNLSMPLLQGLARLLELLSTWFNVTLGGKLLEHLKKWLEPEKLAQCQKAWKAGEEPKIAAAIIELFHLLPSAAGKFLDELVTLTIGLEAALPPGQFYSEINSPYRLPLTKFLNRYPSVAVDYFLARLFQPNYFRSFMYIIRSDAGQPLREELAKSPEKILNSAFSEFMPKSDISAGQGLSSPVAMMSDENLASPLPEGSVLPSVPIGTKSDAYFQGLALVKTLVKLIPGWLQSNRIVFDTLVLLWKSPSRMARLQKEQELSVVQVKESKWLIKCFMNYLRYDKNEVNVLFDILSVFLFRSRIDFTFLKEFYIIEVAEGYPPDMKKTLLLYFLNLFQSKHLGHDHMVVVMQMLILPMLAHAFQNDQSWEVVDTAIIKTIVDKLLDPPEEVSADYDESLRIELLQLATLLIKYLHKDLNCHRKELIKFGWNHLKREDSASKQWAFVNVCHFLDAYQAPDKIILQVFVALLRTCQPENKLLVKQALDILMPALPTRLPPGDSRMPIWIRYTKKILVEEGHSIPNLVHIFQLIVRHSELFFSCRAQFVPQMVNTLSRLGLPYNTTAENRKLAIELAGLVVAWERQRQNEMKVTPDHSVSSIHPDGFHHGSESVTPQRLTDGSSFVEDPSKRVKVEPVLQALGVSSPGGTSSLSNMETLGTSGQPDEEFKPNAAMEEMIITFLIRVALIMEIKDKEGSLMYKQALDLLSQALEVWPTANIKFNYLEKMLNNIQPSQSKDPSTALAQGLDVMNRVLEKQPHIFIRNNINHITQVLEPCFKYKVLDAGKSLCSLLTVVFTAFPLEVATTPQDVKILYQKVEEIIQKNLAAVSASQSSGEDSCASTISFVLYVIRSLAEVQKNLIDPLHLVRVLQRLARDMGSVAGSQGRQNQRSEPDPVVTPRQGPAVGTVISNLKSVLKLMNVKMMIVPDCKRSIIHVLNGILSEKDTDATVLICIVEVVKCWIEEDFRMGVGSSSIFTSKDVVTFLHKLSQVNRQSFSQSMLEEWDAKYLELLFGLCADSNKYPHALRQEVFQKVERQFLLGLRAKDPDMRMNFFSLYHESLGKTLFARLQYIIQIQDWDALSDVFWLKQGLDLILAVLVEDKTITLAPNSARVRPLVVSNSLADSSGVQPMITDVTEGSEETPLTFDTLVSKHAQFLNGMSQLQVADLIIPLRELAHTDSNVAYHLWVLVFPIVWMALQKEEQVTLAKPMINLLSKDYHKRQQGIKPNVMQALLEGLQLSHPQPRMPSELIKYIGKTYNAWHTALALLESHVMLFQSEAKCSESLSELYRLLNEEDMRCGLWKKWSNAAETKAGVSLVQHGYWQQAQSLFYQAMAKATQGTHNSTISKGEMCLWEEQWLNCATQLSQWDVLTEFGKSVENYEILMDSLWKQPDWAYLKDQVIPKAQVEETPKLRIIQAYFALHEKNINGIGDAENIVAKGIDLALEQWCQLPEMSVHSRIPLLQQFQQLVEVQESIKIIVDIANGNKHSGNSVVGGHGGLYADVKDILETWRLRTPNDCDNLSVWYDLLQWRNEIYNIVIDAFKDFGTTNSQLHHLGYRDKAWNVNKLAHITRKHGLQDVCVTILEKMYGHSTMEVQEAFVKIREQAKAFLEMKGEISNGYALVNSTNLEYFPVKHKAEIFRLKGDFLLKLNDCESANNAYSQAISLFKNLPKGWISWGNYCNMAYNETHEEIWLEYSVSCFLQGIKFGVSNSRSHLARVLYLLSFDHPSEPVGRAFDKYLDQIPLWVWLSWIPQLLLSLQRTEAPHCKLVLLKVATMYPQALYYWLRTYLLERRDAANKSELGRMSIRMQQNSSGAGGSSSIGLPDGNQRMSGHGGPSLAASDSQVHQGSQSSAGSQDGGNPQMQDSERSSVGESSMYSGNDQTQAVTNDGQNALRRNGASSLVASAATAFDSAKDIMEALRGKHNNMAAELELLLTEIGSRFVTLPEERLLAVVNALLHRCYKYPTATTAEVPQSLKKELSGVCKACFSADAVNKHVEFVREYKQDFEHDLDPESTATFPSTLSELTQRLKHWKNVLQSNVEDRFPPVLKLEEESKVLRDLHVVDVELPGQYFTDREVATEHTVKLDRVGANVPIVRRHGSSFRRLTLIGSDGSQRHFIVQTSLTPNARSDERILQLFRVMNRMFDKHKESRRRHLCIHTPIIIPVWSQVRMVEDDLMYSTFLEVYENHCSRNDKEADQPITYFKEQLNQAISGQISPEAVVDLRFKAYGEITKNLVTDGILSQYMYKTLPSGNAMWDFKKQFAIQIALSNFMSFMLQIGGRSPNKILFAKNTGKIFQTDFHPAYDANGMIEFNEPVPFRMTRNLQALFSQFGVDGLIVSAMCAAAQAAVSPKQIQHLWHHMAMFFRDELLSWSWRRSPGMPLAPAIGGNGINPSDFKLKVTTNVEQVISRINGISPQYFYEEEENGVAEPQTVQKGVADLVDAALCPTNLCMMDPTWHPWF
ncbi:transformation/transcription domain-associated protein-like [Impatiens glandulifera]|uniref:transformation/transcription domain-associated protein-like n=1 Tax=Impatiens glandulifera TaxID=253017 RepID=UPI001FB0D333|nr:transformation/transcription domain-associated protein-like [Impatiens glandulifera]